MHSTSLILDLGRGTQQRGGMFDWWLFYFGVGAVSAVYRIATWDEGGTPGIHVSEFLLTIFMWPLVWMEWWDKRSVHAPERESAQTQRSQDASPSPDPSPPPAPPTATVVCPRCEQKLRVPTGREIHVTCPACTCKWQGTFHG